MTSVYSHLDTAVVLGLVFAVREVILCVANVGDYKGGYPLGGGQKAEPPCNLGLLGLTHMTDNIIWC